MNDQTATSPCDELRAEHQVILRVIEILKRLVGRFREGGAFERAAFGRCVEFFRLFADACHHAKEEDLLFPALESRGIPREGGPIGVMLEEHRQARALTKEMGDSLDALAQGDAAADSRFAAAADRYADLLMNHIFKEDNVLFNMGDRVLSAGDRKTLCSKFCEVGCGTFGGKKREELSAIADELDARWGDS